MSCNGAFYFISLFFVAVMICVWVYYNLKFERMERVYDRQIASLERENDNLESVIYDLETNILDLEDKLETEQTRLKATINLLSK